MKNLEKRLIELRNQSIVSIDAETNGLWGQAFAIAGVLYNPQGIEIERFTARCPIEGEVDDWVAENVLPEMVQLPVTHALYTKMLEAFFNFLAKHKDAIALCQMGHIVEAKLLRDAYEEGIIGEWGAPYEWYDVCVLFGDSVDNYNKINNVKIDNVVGGTHNPLYDAISAYKAYQDLLLLETSKQKETIALLNTTIVTTEGQYSLEPISLDEVKALLDGNDILSAIGHQSTSDILTELLEVDVPMNRINFAQESGQRAICFKLHNRPEEGKILSREDIEKIGYDFKLLIKK